MLKIDKRFFLNVKEIPESMKYCESRGPMADGLLALVCRNGKTSGHSSLKICMSLSYSTEVAVPPRRHQSIPQV